MSKGTPSSSGGKIVHVICRRCGRHAFHRQQGVCASCGFGATARRRGFSWAKQKGPRAGGAKPNGRARR
ncbi:MAG: 50S ribosomal protein L37e [Thermoplasmata archaeon]